MPVTAGAAASASATNATDGSNAAGAPGAGGAAGSTGAAGISFVQLLTQSAATSSGTEAPAKTTEVPQQEKSAPRDDESGSDSVAMALAMVSQSLAQAASAAAPTTAAAGGNVSAAKSDTAQIPAALAAAARVASAAVAAGTVAGGATGGTVPGSAGAGASGAGAAANADDADSADGPDGSAATAQKLFALLTQGEDAGLGTLSSKDAAQPGDDSQNNSPGNSANAPTVNSSTASAHLSVGSHFSLQHAGNDAKTPADVKSPVGSTAWADELGGKITWMAHQGIESASLRLSPAHLGPVEVRISVQDGGASVWFGAAQADTRAALEQALPRLREMFSTQGLTLADANVSRDPPKQHQHPTGSVQGIASVTGISEESGPHSSSSLSSLRIGLLDTYA